MTETELVFDPKVKISKKAQSRKKKFIATKKKTGIDAMMLNSMFPERKIYFDVNGEITCITQDKDFKPDPDWLTYKFSDAEIEMVCENVSASRFKVYKISDMDGGKDQYEIQESKIKQPVGKVQGTEMILVDTHDDPDIIVEVTDCDVIVSAKPKIIKKVKDNNFKIDNIRVLPFHVTMPGNPHYLIYNFYVPLGDLANKGSVKIPVDDNFTEFSIYTKPVFDSYGRV